MHDGPLVETLRKFAFDRLVSCVDVTRWEKPTRELGVWRLSPAHVASALRYAFLPVNASAQLSSSERALRLGRLLLRTAMRDVLPACVLYRKKSWADAVISPRWFEAGASWMAKTNVGSNPMMELLPDVPGLADAAWRWDRRAPQAAVSAFGLWWRLFVDRAPTNEPPT
jgi:hypothetical protein